MRLQREGEAKPQVDVVGVAGQRRASLLDDSRQVFGPWRGLTGLSAIGAVLGKPAVGRGTGGRRHRDGRCLNGRRRFFCFDGSTRRAEDHCACKESPQAGGGSRRGCQPESRFHTLTHHDERTAGPALPDRGGGDSGRHDDTDVDDQLIFGVGKERVP